jgi:hypothetical protein
VSGTTALLAVLLVVATALCGVAAWALVEWIKAARSLRRLTDDLDTRLVPLLDKADITVDAMNAELLRVDQILTLVEEVADRVSDTSRTVQVVANAPGEIVNDLSERVRRAWKTRKQTHHQRADDSTPCVDDVDPPAPDHASEDTSLQ